MAENENPKSGLTAEAVAELVSEIGVEVDREQLVAAIRDAPESDLEVRSARARVLKEDVEARDPGLSTLAVVHEVLLQKQVDEESKLREQSRDIQKNDLLSDVGKRGAEAVLRAKRAETSEASTAQAAEDFNRIADTYRQTWRRALDAALEQEGDKSSPVERRSEVALFLAATSALSADAFARVVVDHLDEAFAPELLKAAAWRLGDGSGPSLNAWAHIGATARARSRERVRSRLGNRAALDAAARLALLEEAQRNFETDRKLLAKDPTGADVLLAKRRKR